MLGDSVAFGFGHEETATTFPALVEAALDRPGAACRVYNFGVPGYSSYQGLRLLETEVLDYRLDAVCAQFGWNDHWEAYRHADKDQARLLLLLHRRGRWVRRSALAGLIQVGIVYGRHYFSTRALMPDPDRRGGAPTISATRADLLLRVGPEDYRSNLRSIARISRRAGAVPVLATAPHLPGREVCMFRVCFEPEIHERYNGIVRDLCRREGIALADLDAAFVEAAAQGGETLFLSHGIHFSPAGHRLAALIWTKAIRRALGEEPSPASPRP